MIAFSPPLKTLISGHEAAALRRDRELQALRRSPAPGAGSSVVLIGPNNCGKTSALQAIALWSIGLRTWKMESENSKAEKRKGKALNRLSILSVPVPKTRHFWHNLKTGNKDLRITQWGLT